MSGGDFSGFADIGAPLAIERPFEQQAPIPVEQDGFDRVLGAMNRVYTQTGDERKALAYGLEQLCEELTPCIRSPRGVGDRPPSRKAKRRVVAAIRHFQSTGRRDG